MGATNPLTEPTEAEAAAQESPRSESSRMYSGIEQLRPSNDKAAKPTEAAATEETQTPTWLTVFARSVPGLVLALGLVYVVLAYLVPLLSRLR